jgi:hypothetical protein
MPAFFCNKNERLLIAASHPSIPDHASAAVSRTCGSRFAICNNRNAAPLGFRRPTPGSTHRRSGQSPSFSSLELLLDLLHPQLFPNVPDLLEELNSVLVK